MQVIIPPNILTNITYVDGLHIPLNQIAEALSEQDKEEYALAVRYAIQIIDLYSKCMLKKEAIINY